MFYQIAFYYTLEVSINVTMRLLINNDVLCKRVFHTYLSLRVLIISCDRLSLSYVDPGGLHYLTQSHPLILQLHSGSSDLLIYIRHVTQSCRSAVRSDTA